MSDSHFDTIIESRQGWNPVDWRELWRFRELMLTLAWRDIKVRYKQTVLGAAWAVFQPFVSMIIFSVFLGALVRVPSDNVPYPVFVYAGLLPWTFFANCVGGASNSIISEGHLISKIYFPRLIIPVASFGSKLFDFIISFFIMFLIMAYYRMSPGITTLMLPVLILFTMLTALGIGTFFSAVCVTYRDVRYIVPVLIQLWMYATPVVYPMSIVPARWRWVVSLNPLAGLIESYRSALLGRPFDWVSIGVSFAISVAFLIIGLVYFRKAEKRFADII
ncbi:MAG TPA: ABC transporter permease [Dissulfurispiraceae bacterium]